MICVDASAAVKLVIKEEQSDQARALFHSTVQAGESIVAPSLLLFEATNIIRQRVRRREALSLIDAHQALANFLALPIDIHSPPGLHQLAFSIANTYDLPAAYDAHYLALAQRLDCDFWTSDMRLLRRVHPHLSFVHWLGDYPAPAAP